MKTPREMAVKCPCGGIILADTENWTIPICNGCYEELDCPDYEPVILHGCYKAGLERAIEYYAGRIRAEKEKVK